MEEKERYKVYKDNRGNAYICDTIKNIDYKIYQEFVDLLNQQDKHIKELELLLKADNKMKTNSLNGFEKLRQEKQQLREDLQAKDILVNTYMSVVGTLDNAKQLKQSQQQLAISELEKLKENAWQSATDISCLLDYTELAKIIDNQIKELKKEK